MKPTQQQKDNKLVAEFMGLNIITDNISYFDSNYKALKNYHSDWNWLMEVVEKIESLDNIFNIDGLKVYILNNSAWCTAKIGETKIQAVYNACVEFIKWYNEQNRK